MAAFFWMMVGSLGTLAMGFIGNAAFHLWTERRCPRRIETYGLHFEGFPDGLQTIFFGEPMPRQAWNMIPTHLAVNARVFAFFLRSTGTGVIKDLKIKISAGDDSGIAFHKFEVEKQVICHRLTTEKDEDRSILATWSYLNSNDFIDLYVLATGETRPAEITIDVDAEDVRITESFPLAPVNLINPLRSPIIPGNRDHFLEKFVRVSMLASVGRDFTPSDKESDETCQAGQERGRDKNAVGSLCLPQSKTPAPP
jgi:hypothetical protein